MLTDAILLWLAFYFALVLRFDQVIPAQPFLSYWTAISITISVKLILFYLSGLYRPLLRHSGLELLGIIAKVTLIIDGAIIVSSTILAPNFMPRTVQILGAIISLILLISARLAIRSVLWRTLDLNFVPSKLRHHSLNSQNRVAKNILIYGAGITGYQVSKGLLQEKNYRIIAFLDDNPKFHGRELNNIKIYHSFQLESLVNTYKIDQILLAVPSASPKERKHIINRIRDFKVSIKTVPSAEEIVTGRVSVQEFRNIDVTDLLGREEVPPNPELLHANVTKKVVLVTGAGGSIGSELCRQIAQLNPRLLILYDINEFGLYSIDLELTESYPELNLKACLGSVTDRERLTQIFIEHNVNTVYHAAAYKHVPLVEHNPGQGIINNVYGTLVASETAKKCFVETFVLISTDKAVRPTNIMGATKRIAELVLQSFASTQKSTRFIMVRFGNVLGSSGSVVPRFRKQIANGEAITLTHKDITRFFMTIPEAARLVIQAGAMGSGGEVFLLDMGEPVKIYDLAVQMIELSGLIPGQDIDINITGLRPGEKLYEELLIGGDNITQTEHPKIFSAREHMLPWTKLNAFLEKLFDSAHLQSKEEIQDLLQTIVPEYNPTPPGQKTKVSQQNSRLLREMNPR